MSAEVKTFLKSQLKEGLPKIKPGDTVRIHQKIKEGEKERTQMFEGLVLAKKHGEGISSTITLRTEISGVGVERIFPVHSPIIEKIEVLKRTKPRKAKLYFLRKAKGKRARLKKKDLKETLVWEKLKEKAEKKQKEKKLEKKPKEKEKKGSE